MTSMKSERATRQATRMALVGPLIALLALLAGAGCATTSDVSAAEADAQKAMRVAEEARQTANAAAADAAAARRAAEEAAVDAREANEKADRIFRRSLEK